MVTLAWAEPSTEADSGPPPVVYGHDDDIRILWPLSQTGLQRRSALRGLSHAWAQVTTSVSGFIEPDDAQRHGREAMPGQRATQTLKRCAGGWWLTMVGGVPAPTVLHFADAFERS